MDNLSGRVKTGIIFSFLINRMICRFFVDGLHWFTQIWRLIQGFIKVLDCLLSLQILPLLLFRLYVILALAPINRILNQWWGHLLTYYYPLLRSKYIHPSIRYNSPLLKQVIDLSRLSDLWVQFDFTFLSRGCQLL